MAFATLALSELLIVFSIRSPWAHAWQLPRNGWLLGSTAGSAVVVAAVVYVPFAHHPFATVSLGVVEAVAAAALALVPLVVVEAAKEFPARRSDRADESGASASPAAERTLVGALR